MLDESLQNISGGRCLLNHLGALKQEPLDRTLIHLLLLPADANLLRVHFNQRLVLIKHAPIVHPPVHKQLLLLRFFTCLLHVLLQ